MSFFEKKIETLQTYSSLFEIIETEEFKSPLLIELQNKIKDGNLPH
jgi:hypothetical protein